MEFWNNSSTATKAILVVSGIIIVVGLCSLGFLLTGMLGDGPDATATVPIVQPPEGTDAPPPVSATATIPVEIEIPTPEAGKPQIMADVNVYVRSGPDTAYSPLGVMIQGQTAEVLGVSPDGKWWLIVFPGSPDGQGWVSGEWVTTTNTDNVPVVTPPPAPTATPNPPVVITEWKGEYFNNPNLQGEPVLVRNDEHINFDWSNASPAPEVPANDFSVRWTIARDVPAGTYRLSAWMDDGMRVFVDNSLVIDEWRAGPVRNVVVDLNLPKGVHEVRVEYFQGGGGAYAALQIGYLEEYPDWRAEYYNTPNLNGDIIVLRNETDINYNWGANAPAPGVQADNFSARWTRGYSFDSAPYIFRATVEGGVRMWVDNNLVIDDWASQGLRTLESQVIDLSGGRNLRVEYFKERGNGQLRIEWETVDTPPAEDDPVARITGPDSADVGQVVSFDGLDSTPGSNSQITQYVWEFGDGDVATGPVVQHAYNAPGDYQVTLSIQDDRNRAASDRLQIRVSGEEPTAEPDDPPTAVIDAPASGILNEPITFDGSQSNGSNPLVSYLWDFGDGGTADAIRIDHSYARVGLYNVTLTVVDQNGLQDRTNVQVDVVAPEEPTATPEEPTATPEEPTATPEPEATDTPAPSNPPAPAMSINPNPAQVGDSVTFDGSASTPGDGGAIVSYEWRFGDGSTATGPVVTYVYQNGGSFEVNLIVTDESNQTNNTLGSITVEEVATPTDTPDTPNLDGTSWLWDNSLPDAPATIQFSGSNVSVNGGCNTYTGSYTTNGSDITINLGPSTGVACTDDVQAQETGYVQGVSGATSFSVSGSSLTLSGVQTLIHSGMPQPR